MRDETSQATKNKAKLPTAQLSINSGLAAPSHETILVASRAMALPKLS